MSKYHLTRQGFLGSATLPNISRAGQLNAGVLLLGSGTNGSTNIIDSSVNNFTVNRFGNTQISTAQFPTGMTSSILFDGTNDYLSINANTAFDINSGDFTIEFWVYPTVNKTFATFLGVWGQTGNSDSTWLLGAESGTLGFFWLPFNNTTRMLNGGTVPLNTWTYISVTRTGNTFRIWRNGLFQASQTSTNSIGIAPLTIGWYGFLSTANRLQGNISNVRIIKGLSLYQASSNYTPPSLPLANSVPATINNNIYGLYQNY